MQISEYLVTFTFTVGVKNNNIFTQCSRLDIQWKNKRGIRKNSICILQEAHCTQKSSKTWAAEWGYTALFSSLASNKVGVTILLNNNFSFKILRQLWDKESRCSIVDLGVGDLTVNLCSMYAPKTDDPAFFKNAKEKMLSFKCDEIIIGGDFNLALDVSKDKTLFFFFFRSYFPLSVTVALHCTVAVVVLCLLVAFYFVPFSIVFVILSQRLFKVCYIASIGSTVGWHCNFVICK